MRGVGHLAPRKWHIMEYLNSRKTPRDGYENDLNATTIQFDSFLQVGEDEIGKSILFLSCGDSEKTI